MDDNASFDQISGTLIHQLRQTDLTKKINALGLQQQGPSFLFDFFNQKIAFDGNDFQSKDDLKITPALKVLFSRYLLQGPQIPLKSTGKLLTFREFANAGPLFSKFAANTGKIIQTSFSGQIVILEQQCLKTGGMILESLSYDLSVRFLALPKIPMILNFNDADDIMPATAGFLYHETAESYLDIKSLGTTCTYLTGCLIQNL